MAGWPGRGARQQLAEYLGAPSLPATSTTTRSPPAIRSCAARSATRARRRRCASSPRPTWCWRWVRRLGPFGTLPQYDIEYWPKQAKIVQVDVPTTGCSGLVRPGRRRHRTAMRAAAAIELLHARLRRRTAGRAASANAGGSAWPSSKARQKRPAGRRSSTSSRPAVAIPDAAAPGAARAREGDARR